jgi:hypothetical protein
MEQERRQDVSQMSMIQIPQGNIYQPWNKSFPVYVDRLDTSVVNHVKTQHRVNRKLPLQNISNTKPSGQSFLANRRVDSLDSLFTDLEYGITRLRLSMAVFNWCMRCRSLSLVRRRTSSGTLPLIVFLCILS